MDRFAVPVSDAIVESALKARTGLHAKGENMRKMLPLAVLAFLLSAISSLPSHAQTRDSQKMLDKSFQSSAGALKYLLFVPEDYDETRRYPLVVSLRGAGSTYITATDNFEMAHPWIVDSIQARVPHFIMVPECLSGTWGGLAGAPSNGVMAAPSKAVMEAIEDLKKQYSLDTNRFILTGFSLGGSGTYHILELKPNYWAAAVPCAAGGDSSKIKAMATTAIWHHQGSNDGSAGRRMSQALENNGYKVVRMVCDFTINSPAGWRTAAQGGARPEDIAFRNARPPVTVDSLRRAIDAGAPYIYTELTGGNHESGWMGAAHNPLLARWAFSRVRGGHTVSLAPREGRKAWMKRNGTVLGVTGLYEATGETFTLTGQRLVRDGAAPRLRIGAQPLVFRDRER
jgi:poly(3-hydroxybutyrate) depolymerase